jgi:hypothetical protein
MLRLVLQVINFSSVYLTVFQPVLGMLLSNVEALIYIAERYHRLPDRQQQNAMENLLLVVHRNKDSHL